MDIANLMVLAWISFAVSPSTPQPTQVPMDECFGNPPYICDGESSKKSCDCDDEETCYFKLLLEDDEREIDGVTDKIITINGLFQGPTLIVNQNATVVVDLVNNMVEETSIHWHGMHQYNVPWMDGVGNITQWGIQPGRKFRYIFEATPSGTFWYHSHVGEQRILGLFGALIVNKIPAPVFPDFDVFEDKPDEHTLVFLDFKRKNPADFNTTSRYSTNTAANERDICYPDGSNVPSQAYDSIPILNGMDLPEGDAKTVRSGWRRSASDNLPQISTFKVTRGNTYRFRLVGAMRASAFRFSIDHHKLFVVATDGYLVEPVETDYIILHSGERYDFLLEAKNKINCKRWYRMRMETLAINCISGEPLPGSGWAWLKYVGSNEALCPRENPNFNSNPRGCKVSAPCKVMNCPFKAYGDGVPLECHHVDELKLLHETPAGNIPVSENIVLKRTWFFDFGRPSNSVALVNKVQFEFPDIALQVSSYSGRIDECGYDDTNCSSSDNPDKCVHIVNIPDEYYKTSLRFVFSSLGDTNGVFTHPIHLHGHSFQVVKIGYPSYLEDGIIDKHTPDLQPSDCGPASWKNDCVPDDIEATSKTVRKDTIMVPAGGYVVIEFLADNPGYWFLHCHIDPHLESGMAAVIREVKGYQNLPPPANLTEINKDFCWTLDDFKEQKNYLNPCNETLDNPPTVQDQLKSDKPISKERQAELVKEIINRRQNLESMIEKDSILKDQPGSRISGKDDPRAWKLRDTPFKDRWERRFKEKIHASKQRPVLPDWNVRLRKKGSAEHK